MSAGPAQLVRKMVAFAATQHFSFVFVPNIHNQVVNDVGLMSEHKGVQVTHAFVLLLFSLLVAHCRLHAGPAH